MEGPLKPREHLESLRQRAPVIGQVDRCNNEVKALLTHASRSSTNASERDM